MLRHSITAPCSLMGRRSLRWALIGRLQEAQPDPCHSKGTDGDHPAEAGQADLLQGTAHLGHWPEQQIMEAGHPLREGMRAQQVRGHTHVGGGVEGLAHQLQQLAHPRVWGVQVQTMLNSKSRKL